MNEAAGQNAIVIYQSAEKPVEVWLDADRETVWLSQRQMAEVFDTSTDNIGLHLKNIYSVGELEESATTEESSVVRQEGRRRVTRQIKHYNLDAIISVGYRVNSRRAVQFRQWATRVLREHLIQGTDGQGLHLIPQSRDLALGKIDEGRRRVSDFDDDQIAHVGEKIRVQFLEILAAVINRLDRRQDARHIADEQRVAQIGDDVAVDHPHDIENLLVGHGPFRAGHDLIQQAQRIPHAAAGLARHEGQAFPGDRDALPCAKIRHLTGKAGDPDAPQIVALAAREDRHRDFVRLRRREHEEDMGRGFFQGLQQSVEGRRTQHMHFIDDVILKGL